MVSRGRNLGGICKIPGSLFAWCWAPTQAQSSRILHALITGRVQIVREFMDPWLERMYSQVISQIFFSSVASSLLSDVTLTIHSTVRSNPRLFVDRLPPKKSLGWMVVVSCILESTLRSHFVGPSLHGSGRSQGVSHSREDHYFSVCMTEGRELYMLSNICSDLSPRPYQWPTGCNAVYHHLEGQVWNRYLVPGVTCGMTCWSLNVLSLWVTWFDIKPVTYTYSKRFDCNHVYRALFVYALRSPIQVIFA